MKFLDLFAGIQTSWQLSRSQCGCGDSKGIEMKLKINRRDSFQIKPVYFKQGEQMTIFDFLEEKNGMHTRKDIRCQK
ncbi:hypothetical protein [Streptococcus intermedius]|uniref:hypothetical protein n=1 Tax=Streptococcus intermedius TaxID=1338 RepID=UPI000E3D4498|nr:hypothetical protein [Streptococcus intermedius]